MKCLCHAAPQTCHSPCVPTSDGLDLGPACVCVCFLFERVVIKVEEEAEEEFRKTATAGVGAKQSVTPIQALGHRNSGTSDLYFTVQSGQPYTQLCLQNIIIQWDYFFQRHKESLRNGRKKCQSLSSFDFSSPPQLLPDNTTVIQPFKHMLIDPSSRTSRFVTVTVPPSNLRPTRSRRCTQVFPLMRTKLQTPRQSHAICPGNRL